MSATEVLQRRVVQLEELFSHQEHTVQQLNDSVIQLRKELDQLEAKCNEQEGRIRSLAEGHEPTGDPLDEQPPHY